jgi:hypothetical protein
MKASVPIASLSSRISSTSSADFSREKSMRCLRHAEEGEHLHDKRCYYLRVVIWEAFAPPVVITRPLLYEIYSSVNFVYCVFL